MRSYGQFATRARLVGARKAPKGCERGPCCACTAAFGGFVPAVAVLKRGASSQGQQGARGLDAA